MIQKVVLTSILLQASVLMAGTPNDPKDSVTAEHSVETAKVNFEAVDNFFHSEIDEMNNQYRFVRQFENNGKYYFLYAEDVLGESTYKLLGIDASSKSSFVLTLLD